MKNRKNRNRRKSQTMNVLTGKTFHVAGIIAALVTMVVVNLVADTRCTQTIKSIGEKEKQLARLEQDRLRESTAWDAMTTAENLDRALVRHGLNMRYPKPEQVVRMDASGTPRYGQTSVKLALQRKAAAGTVVQNTRARHRR